MKQTRKEMEKIGGIRRYQDASVFDYSFRKDRPDKWIVEVLTENGLKPTEKGAKVLKPNAAGV